MNILTIDVEDWFHILDNESTRAETNWRGYECRIHANMDRIFDLLERKNTRATFFCMGWIAKKYPEIIKKIDALGYEIAAHSYFHQLVYDQTKSEFSKDLKMTIQLLEDISGKKVITYRAPGFSFTEETRWIADILFENKIKIDCSIFPKQRAQGGYGSIGENTPFLIKINGKKIKEFPMITQQIIKINIPFSGGGYFRVLPYWISKSFAKKKNYIMAYFHPRDFDPDQPKIKDLSIIRRFKSYYGLSSAQKKLEKLLDDFEFIDLRTADNLINWKTAKIINL